jgi:hypothetical protein
MDRRCRRSDSEVECPIMGFVLGIALLVLAVAIDLMSLFCEVRAVWRRSPSGVPLLPLLLYWIGLRILQFRLGVEKTLPLFGVACVFHFLCQIGFPTLVIWLATRRRKGEDNTSRAKE